VEDLLQKEAGHKLNSGSEQNRSGIKDEDVIAKGVKHNDDCNDTKSVDRAIRTVKKSAVDEYTVFHSLIHYLEAPAEERIDDEEPEHLV